MLLRVEVGCEGFVEEMVTKSGCALIDVPDFPTYFEQFGFVCIDCPDGDAEQLRHFLNSEAFCEGL